MEYRTARKLHNGDEVTVKRTDEGDRNVSATVSQMIDHEKRRVVELVLFMPNGGLGTYLHKEVK